MEVQDERRLRIGSLLTEAVTSLCKNMLNYDIELSVEGLLGITVDRKDVVLVNIKQMVHNSALNGLLNSRECKKPNSCGKKRRSDESDDSQTIVSHAAKEQHSCGAPGKPPAVECIMIKDEPESDFEDSDECKMEEDSMLFDAAKEYKSNANENGLATSSCDRLSMSGDERSVFESRVQPCITTSRHRLKNTVPKKHNRLPYSEWNHISVPCAEESSGTPEYLSQLDVSKAARGDSEATSNIVGESSMDNSLALTLGSLTSEDLSYGGVLSVTNGKFLCPYCPRAFSHKRSLWRHVRSHTIATRVQCDVCKKSFGRRDTLLRHMDLVHNTVQLKCPQCDKTFSRGESVQRHLLQSHSGATGQLYLEGLDISNGLEPEEGSDALCALDDTDQQPWSLSAPADPGDQEKEN